MGSRIGKVCLCSTSAGDISGRDQNPFGNSICYIRPPYPFSDNDVTHVTTFRSLSGASVSANSSTPPSTVSTTNTTTVALDSSASFESSPSFTSSPMPLELPRHTSRAGSSAGSYSAVWCSPTERGFSSQKLQRRFSYGLENKPKKQNLKNILKRVISKSIVVTGLVSNRIYNNKKNKEKVKDTAFVNAELGCGLDDDDDDDKYLDDGGGLFFMGSENLQWAQGRAGEDRLHIVISEENGWVFVGIYDGFNGPDATDYLLDNLFFAVYDELKVLLNLDAVSKMNSRNSSCNNEGESEEDAKSALAFGHSDVLLALSEALRKTEDAFLKGVDEMISNNSVLAMMGSCVLVMLMKGQDVYLMNVGDSRAVLATDHSTKSVQLTMEHSTLVKEEVHRIRKEHLDDPSAITKGRVKGYLNVTRAFGVGFLKQPKQNNAILEAFKVNYIGESPYITCCPSLYHHRLSPSDRFLILCSDGLHQYFTNEEAVAKVESFITLSPDMDPAQLLIKEALTRAAKKAGMDFHELLEIPQGERRHYHDDISIVIISFEGKIWRSSV